MYHHSLMLFFNYGIIGILMHINYVVNKSAQQIYISYTAINLKKYAFCIFIAYNRRIKDFTNCLA